MYIYCLSALHSFFVVVVVVGEVEKGQLLALFLPSSSNNRLALHLKSVRVSAILYSLVWVHSNQDPNKISQCTHLRMRPDR